jgi:hypothetical protein
MSRPRHSGGLSRTLVNGALRRCRVMAGKSGTTPPRTHHRRRQRRQRPRQHGPRGRCLRGQRPCIGLCKPPPCKHPRRRRRQRSQVPARPIHHSHRKCGRDLAPGSPAMQGREIVGAHQPDEPRARMTHTEKAQGVDRVSAAERSFERRHRDPRRVGNLPCLVQSTLRWHQFALVLQRIPRRYDPPDGIQIQSSPGDLADLAMSGMGRIEGPAE